MTAPTLAELKAAIEAVPPDPKETKGWTWIIRHQHQKKRADAWRTAFEWHVGLVDRYAKFDDQGHITDALTLDRECKEGMRLIREHLK